MTTPDAAAAEPLGQQETDYGKLFEHSPKMRALREMIGQVAATNATVLICGESGVGKELVARAIHAASPRHDRLWVKVNCAALPAELIESELFGHEKGSFTGAHQRKIGKFEAADTGTIFLDEIGELPLAVQPKLLHVLQDLEFSRVGGHAMIPVDVRVIAATNRDLGQAMSAGLFREDLYYRLNVVELCVPPLRERREEIPHLIRYYLTLLNKQYGRDVACPGDILALCHEYWWPGNVRELENLLRRLVVLADPQHVRAELLNRIRATSTAPSTTSVPAVQGPPGSEAGLGLKDITRRATLAAEGKALREVLERVHWNRAQAARILRVSYKTLLNKIAACGLSDARGPQKVATGNEDPRR